MSSVESGEARASSISIVADTSSRAVTAGFVTISIKRIGTGRALLELASGASVAGVAEASYMLHVVPRSIVSATGLGSQVLFRPASTAVVAVVRTSGTLTSNTIIARKAGARTSLAIARALVGALHPRVQVVGVDHFTNPGEVARACAKRAIRASPLRLTVQTSEALAVVVLLAGAVVGAVVLAKTSVAVAALVPDHLAPRLGSVCRSAGRSCDTVSTGIRTLR